MKRKNAPLRHPSSKEPFVQTADASNYALDATLEQGRHPASYRSHQVSEEEVRRNTGDQALLAAVIPLRAWAVCLQGRPFIM